MWVANYGGKTVSTVNVVTGKVGQTISVPEVGPNTIAFTPDGRTAYVVGNGNATVTPITVATGKPGRPIKVTTDPKADLLAISIVQAQS